MKNRASDKCDDTLNSLTLLIGRKRAVNFRNHNCRLYNNHVKDTQGHK